MYVARYFEMHVKILWREDSHLVYVDQQEDDSTINQLVKRMRTETDSYGCSFFV